MHVCSPMLLQEIIAVPQGEGALHMQCKKTHQQR